MGYSFVHSKRAWYEALPFGILLSLWGFANLWLCLRQNSTEVLPPQVASIWLVNGALFAAGGLAGVVYISLRVRHHAARMEAVLEGIPFAAMIAKPDNTFEYCNQQARELIENGVMQGVHDVKNWRLADTEIYGLQFKSIYSSHNMHLAMCERSFAARRGRVAGNVLLFFNVTHWQANAQNTMELADILHELDTYLGEASNSFTESIRALAGSTVNQAVAFQQLAEYMQRVANDVEMDAQEIRGTMQGMAVNIGDCTVENSKNLRKLNESALLMQKSHLAAQKARDEFELIKQKYS